MTKRLTIRLPPDADGFLRLIDELRLAGELRIAAAVDVDAFMNRFETSLDSKKVESWLATKSQPPNEIVAVFLFAVTALSEWETLPKRTQVEHRRLYDGIAEQTHRLNESTDATGSVYNHGYGWGMQDIELSDLLKRAERERWEGALVPGAKLSDLDLPSAADLVDRLGMIATDFSSRGTHHAQPTKRGAKRGYFIRRLAGLFQARYNEVPAEVIAAVATIALQEPTDRELVVKTLK